MKTKQNICKITMKRFNKYFSNINYNKSKKYSFFSFFCTFHNSGGKKNYRGTCVAYANFSTSLSQIILHNKYIKILYNTFAVFFLTFFFSTLYK